jgi:hypothetical protein
MRSATNEFLIHFLRRRLRLGPIDALGLRGRARMKHPRRRIKPAIYLLIEARLFVDCYKPSIANRE